MKFLFNKKMKNIVCLVGLILLGFFVLKHFNLIEGLDDTTTEETPQQAQERRLVELVTKAGKAAGDGIAESKFTDNDGKKNGDKKGPSAGGDGNYTVNINVEAPKMDTLSPKEYNNNAKTTE